MTEIRKEFEQYKKSLFGIKNSFGIKIDIHKIYWCRKIAKRERSNGHVFFAVFGDKKGRRIGDEINCTVYQGSDYVGVVVVHFEEPVELYITEIDNFEGDIND